jgi:hypothetical protein
MLSEWLCRMRIDHERCGPYLTVSYRAAREWGADEGRVPLHAMISSYGGKRREVAHPVWLNYRITLTVVPVS